MMSAKIQHYVPQFLLRKFGNGKKDQVWVYDKTTNRSFSTNAKNIASESRFYDFEIDGRLMSLEPMLSTLESKAKILIDRILKADSIAALSDDDKTALATFLSVQFTRTKTFREQWCELPKMLRERLEARGETVVPGSQADELTRDLTVNQSKAETARFMVRAPDKFAPHFLNKQWLLAATTRKHPFIISDNPVTLQNKPRGDLSLAVEGIEIYFPLSPERALAMWCPSIVDMVRQDAEKLRGLPSAVTNASISNPNGLLALDQAILTGEALTYSKESVLNFNSLQVARSERYVFSYEKNFELAEEMVKSHTNLRRGPRAEVV